MGLKTHFGVRASTRPHSRQQLGRHPEFPSRAGGRNRSRPHRAFYVAAELLGVNDIATDKMLIRRASAPLQIEEVVATERERRAVGRHRVHPEAACS